MSKEQENSRNPDGTFKKGFSGNPEGRPKDTLKAFIARELRAMDDDGKRKWLKEHNISGELMWKMGEGNPSTHSDITSDGEKITFAISEDIAKKNAINTETEGDSEG